MAILKHTVQFLCGVAAILSLSVNHNPVFSQTQVRKNLEMHSEILERKVPYSILLPAGYTDNQKEYPVIYLLHGFGGDHTSWINRCRINELIDSLKAQGDLSDCIYVLPDAEKSYYLNNFDSSCMYTDFFLYELVPYIDSVYKTVSDKAHRALLGLSMGGFGTIVLALKYPDVFGTVVAFSAAVRTEDQFRTLPQPRYEIFFASVYGPRLTPEERITDHWKKNSPYYLVDSLNSPQLKTINWYIDCGLDDPLLSANEALHDLMKAYGIPHEFHVRPGNHNWDYWHTAVIGGFIYIDEQFRKSN
jgi:enterochelin esterase-like enzyme